MAQTHDTTTTPSAHTQIITLTQLSEHGTQKDLWIAVHGKVYDLTSFAHDHPGGIEVLTDNTGADGTETFDYAGHGSHQVAKLARYQVGVLPASKVNDAAADRRKIKQEQKTKLNASGGGGGGDNGKSTMTTVGAGNALRNLARKIKSAVGTDGSSSSSSWSRLLAQAVCALVTIIYLLRRGLSTTTSNISHHSSQPLHHHHHQQQQQPPDFQLTPAQAFYVGLLFASSLSCVGLGVLYTKFTATTKHEMDVFAYPPVISMRKK